jgi:subtilisin family serine protease
MVLVKFTPDFGSPNVSLKNGVPSTGNSELDGIIDFFSIYNMEKVFNHPPSDDYNLSRWYKFEFPLEVATLDVLNGFQNLTFVEASQPNLLRKFDYQPNDPLYNGCWHLEKIKADSAWDIHRGSYLVDICIVDSGIDTAHVDLREQMWLNYGEDISGPLGVPDSVLDIYDMNLLDDDGNGYVNDFWGWDFSQWDMYPYDDQAYLGSHGTHCSGDASARTDNGIGVAGVGFATRIMTCRAADLGNPGYINTGAALNGIYYAANNGASAISLSWGGPQLAPGEQEAITYAWNQGAVICASAGNNGATGPYNHYPSKCDHTIAVGASNQNDQRAGFSNYCITRFDGNCDVMSPGVAILGPTMGGGYQAWDGTSMATPIVAGIAGLIRGLAPQLTAAEVETLICNNCDDISAQNPGIAYGIYGFGRVNAFNCLLDLAPYFYYSSYQITDNGNNDGRADPGETIQLTVNILNDARAQNAQGISAILSCEDDAVNITTSQSAYNTINAGATSPNTTPFVFEVLPCWPHYVTFYLTLSGEVGLPIEVHFDLELGRPLFLFVDDDNNVGNNITPYYTSCFGQLDMFVDVWNQASGEISTDELQRYEVVMWATGASATTLNTNERTALEQYLSLPGKNFFFSSTNAGPDIGTTTFYSDYLRASFVRDSVISNKACGIAGNIISDGDTLFFMGGTSSGIDSSFEEINPINGAQEVFRYLDGTTGGIMFDDGDNKIVYYGFALDCAAQSASSYYTPRWQSLQRLLDWFGITGVAPSGNSTQVSNFRLGNNYPNPFNPITNIDFDIPRTAEGTLKVYNTAGQVVAVLMNGTLTAGHHTAVLDASGLASGVYIVALTVEERTLTQKIVLMK